MDAVLASALEAIEADRTRKVIEALHLTRDTLFYDTTHFFPSIASGNERSALAQRGHSTQQRTALRQFRLALLGARDGQMPL
jgi:transposase